MDDEELEEQEGEELPDREVMSIITPNPEQGFPIDVDPHGDPWE